VNRHGGCGGDSGGRKGQLSTKEKNNGISSVCIRIFCAVCLFHFDHLHFLIRYKINKYTQSILFCLVVVGMCV